MERQFLFSLFLWLPHSILAWKIAKMLFRNFSNFLLFFWNFLYLVEQERNRTLIFIFSLSQSCPPYFGLKWCHYCIFEFFEFFCYFFGIFYFESGRNETERKFLFSLFLCLFQTILAWNEAIMIFFNFLNLLLFFWNFLLRVV